MGNNKKTLYSNDEYEKFISRLHPTYKKEVSKSQFERLVHLICTYKGIVLNVGYGTYLFEKVENEEYIEWYIGKEKTISKDEAQILCSNAWQNISNFEML